MTLGGKGLTALVAVLIVFSTITPYAAVAGAQTEAAGNLPTETRAGNQPTATPTEGPSTTEPGETPSETETRTEAPPNGTATAAPVGPSSNTTDARDAPENLTTAPPVVKKYYAVEVIADLDAGGHHGHSNHIDRAHDRVNGTLPYYQDATRVNDSARFTDDAVGVRALAHLHDTNQSDEAERAAQLVYEADDESARVAVADARRVLDRHGDDMANQGLRRSAEAHLDTAERALDRADRAAERGDDGRRYFGARAQAITQLRTAHRHANMVLRFVGRDVDPTVTAYATSDPIRNGTEPTSYTVTGTVQSVDPSDVGNVTVTVNGDRTVTTGTSHTTAPGRNVTYRATLNLTERVNVIEVGLADGSATNASLALDGDGLPGEYERTVTGTDPLDFDSDTSSTVTDEAGNGTIDGNEDFDGDGLRARTERQFGTDPTANDSDGDGLTDGDEYAFTQTDPLVPDSDGDGALDADEDPDGDDLTHEDEIANGTDPLHADVDRDDLVDPREIDLGTDPLVADTDGDGLLDGEEPGAPFATDPTDDDTDGDGVLDGNESYTTTTGNESLGTTVSLTGQGNVARGTTVERAQHARFSGDRVPSEASLSQPVHVGVEGNLTNASVAIEYDGSAVQTNESSVAVYRFNETTGAYHRLPSTVDAANDTVTATTSHFSTVIAIDAGAASKLIRERMEEAASARSSGPGETASFDFEADDEVSLDSGESATVNGATWTCRNDPRGGQYSDTPVSGTCEIGGGDAFVSEETNRMRYLEHTLTLPEAGADEGVFVEADLMAHVESEWSNAAVTLVLEDENGNEFDVFRMEQDYGGSSHTVTANPRVDVSEFAGQEVTVSFRADGRWTYNRQNTNAWIRVEDFAVESTGGAATDSDGDGISDAWEEGGVPLANTTRTVTLDPNDPDTDGDGKEDGEEVDMDTFLADQDLSDDDVLHFPGFAWSSDPKSIDSDGDGIRDERERKGWTITAEMDGGTPQRWDSDGTEIEVTSDPLDPDTDDDGLQDGMERDVTHTDPREKRTYAVTERHQQFLDEVETSGYVRLARVLHVIDEGESLSSLELDDSSDDYDFVLTDGSTLRERVAYTAADGEQRTDRWLPSYEEWGHETDPWDADTDDDGLTDGQEVYGLTQAGVTVERGWFVDTDPKVADTDDDGLLDGADRCPKEAGPEERDGCQFGFSKELALPADADNALVHFRLRPTKGQPYASRGYLLMVNDGDGNSQRITVGSPPNNSPASGVDDRVLSERFDLSKFDGETVTIELRMPREVRFHHFTVGTDDDRDQLIDAVEDREGWTLPAIGSDGTITSRFETSSSVADTDGDGLDDGEEVTFYRRDGDWEVFLPQSYANPALEDTDQDTVGDAEEVNEKCTKAYALDTDFDGKIDANDPDPCDPYNLGYRLGQGGRASIEGAVLGETGMPGGILTSGYHDDPGYLVGWIVGAATPGVEVATDLRDAAQNVGQGDWGEASLDGVSLLPFFADDVPKTLSIIKKWVKVNPSKADDAYRAVGSTGLPERLPKDKLDEYHEAFGMGDDYKRVVADGGVSFKKVDGKLQRLNNEWLAGELRKGEKFAISDVDFATRTAGGKQEGDLVYLIDTKKWSKSTTFEKGAHGWRHIVARHAHPETADKFDWPARAAPGAAAKADTDLYPRHMGPDEIKKSIERVIESAGKSDVTKQNNGYNKITYSGSATPSGVDEMVVVYDRKTGQIVTSYPTKGPDVVKKGNI